MIDLRTVREVISNLCGGGCEGNLVIECGDVIKIYVNVGDYEYGSPPDPHLISKFIFQPSSQTVLCGKGGIRYVIYSFKKNDRGCRLSTYISSKPRFSLLSRGLLGSTVYKGLSNGIYLGDCSHLPTIELGYASSDIVKWLRPIVIRAFSSHMEHLNLQYKDPYSIAEETFKRFFKDSQNYLKPLFYKLNKIDSTPKIRYGYYNGGLPFIEFNESIYPARESGNVFREAGLYILRDASRLNIEPPYIEIDLWRGSKILYIGDLIGGCERSYT